MAKPPSQELVELAMRRMGVNDHVELAVRIGVIPARALNPDHRSYPQNNLLQKVKNWINGVNAPSFTDLMAMLSEAELLAPEAAELFPRAATAAELEVARRALGAPQDDAGRRRSQGDRG